MKEAKLVFGIVLALVALGFVAWGGHTVLKWREGAMQNEARGRTMEATEGLIEDGSRADQERTRQEGAVVQAGAQYDRLMTEAERNDEKTRHWRTVPVPDSVRRAAHERRLARERSADVPEQPAQRR